MGRPSSFSQQIADEICFRLAQDESLASICADEGMPGLTTVYRWRDDNDAFRADYARARTDQGHTVADTIGDIRKQILSGEIKPDVGKAAADLAKWEASRRASRDYGDKTLIGSDPDNPLPAGFIVEFENGDAAPTEG